jgi:beta-lactam-binding protein with PASTA domain
VIGDFDWDVDRREGRLDGSEAGSIIAQVPEVGASLDDGDTLKVTVSLGNAMVEIPSDLNGLTLEQAQARLQSVGLELGQATEENNEALAPGLVIGIDEPISQKPRGEDVSIRLSLGASARVVPGSVIGLNVEEAIGLLFGLRLQPIEEPVFDPAAAEGTVLGSDPAPGETVPADSAVTLFVSAGPEPVEVPDVTGLALDEAIDLIEALGLVFVNTEGTPGEPAIGTDPAAGDVVDFGTEVLIILDDPPDDDEEEEEEADEG